jgi:GDP-4-dehydro-6-deoxy-D-mannose reductase
VYQTLLAEHYYRNYALHIVMARTFNILGKELSPELSIGSFMRQIDALPDGGVIKVGNISTSRDFLDIDEVAHRYWNILMKGRPGEIYNVCSGVPRTIRSVLDQLIRESGKKLVVETDPSLLKDKDIALIYGDSTKYQDLVR